MEENTIVVERVVSASAAQLQTDQSAPKPQQPIPPAEGSVVEAKVFGFTDRGNAIIDVNGVQYELKDFQGLRLGQTLTVRVVSLHPDMMLEIASPKIPMQQSLSDALRLMLINQNDFTDKQISTLLHTLGKIQINSAEKTSLVSLINQLTSQLKPLVVEGNTGGLVEDIKALIENLGTSRESMLRDAALDKIVLQLPVSDIRTSLGQILSQLEAELQSTALNLGQQGKLEINPQIIEQLQIAINKLHSQLIGELDTTSSRRLNREFARINTLIDRFTESDTRLQPNQLRQIFNALKTLPQIFGEQASAGSMTSALEQRVDLLMQELETIFARSQQANSVLRMMTLENSIETAKSVKDKLDALQMFNAHTNDRTGQMQFFIPVKIMEELVDVHFKHVQDEDDRKKGNKETFTVVMLLELQTLGKIRVDAFIDKKQLYCHLAVERPDVVTVVDELSKDFKLQLSARGIKLQKLICEVDDEKIEQFDDLPKEITDTTDGLLDLRI